MAEEQKIKIELLKIETKNCANTRLSYCLFKTVSDKVIIMFIAFPMRLFCQLD